MLAPWRSGNLEPGLRLGARLTLQPANTGRKPAETLTERRTVSLNQTPAMGLRWAKLVSLRLLTS